MQQLSTFVLLIPLVLVLQVAPVAAAVIPQAGWTLKAVDSEELVGENGAAVNAFDGDVNTLWHTHWLGSAPAHPHRLDIDLGAVYALNGFRYLPRQDGGINGRVKSYAFYVSADGVSWGTAVATGVFPNSAVEQEVLFTTTSGRYIRFEALSEQTGGPYTSAAELNVLGTAVGGGNLAPNGVINTPSDGATVVVGGALNFTATGSDPDNNLPLTYVWTFGDPTVPAATVADPGAVTFNTVGTHTVRLTVTDSLGLADATPATIQVNVIDPPTTTVIPQAGWTLKAVDSEELVGENGAAVNAFDGDVNTLWHTHWLGSAPGHPHRLDIDLGAVYALNGFRYLPRQDGGINGRVKSYAFYVSADGVSWGTAVATGVFPNSAVEQEVLFTTTSGRYIRFEALSEQTGGPYTSAAELNVLGTAVGGGNLAPNGVINTPSDGATVVVGGALNFTATGSDPDNNLPLTYVWTFGDPTVPAATVADPGAVTFNTVGTHTVRLTVTDSLGLADATPATIQVNVIDPPTTTVIPQAGWTLKAVDSEELVGENGAAVNAFDGDVNTLWHTHWLGSAPGHPHRLDIDLGAVYALNGFRYLPRQDGGINGRVKSYAFYVSADGVSWGTAVATGVFPNSAVEQEVLFTTTSGRYIRFEALSEQTGGPYTSAAELTLLGQLPSGQTLIGQELFNDGNANGWAVTDNGPYEGPSNWSVVGNQYVQNRFINGQTSDGFELGTYSVWTAFTHNDMDLRLRLRSDGIGVVGVMFGYQNNDNYYRFALSKREGYQKLEKRSGGTFSELATNPQSYTSGQWMDIRIVLQNDVMVVFVDGRQVLAAADTSFTSGKIGLYTSRNTSAVFDDLLVMSAPTLPVIGLSMPGEYFVETGLAVDVTALTTLPVGGVQFVADEGTGSEQTLPNDLAAPYQGQFVFGSPGVHAIRAYALDGSAGRLSQAEAMDEAPNVGAGGFSLTGFGDSITDGFLDDIAGDDISLDGRNTSGGYEPVLNNTISAAFPANAVNVIDEGNPGDRAWQGADKISAVLARNPETQALLVMFGTNDSSGTLFTDPVDFKTYLKSIADASIAQGKKVFFAKPPPVVTSTTLNNRIAQYNARIDELIAEYASSNPGQVFAGPNFFDDPSAIPVQIGPDNIHPTGQGYQTMGDQWGAVIILKINEGAL